MASQSGSPPRSNVATGFKLVSGDCRPFTPGFAMGWAMGWFLEMAGAIADKIRIGARARVFALGIFWSAGNWVAANCVEIMRESWRGAKGKEYFQVEVTNL